MSYRLTRVRRRGLGWDGISPTPAVQAALTVCANNSCSQYYTGSPVHWPQSLRDAQPGLFRDRWLAVFGPLIPVTPPGVFPADVSTAPPYPGSAAWYATQGPYGVANNAANDARAAYFQANPQLLTVTPQAVTTFQSLLQDLASRGAKTPTPPPPADKKQTVTDDSPRWFQEESIDGIPNWMLLAGGVGAVALLARGKR